MYNVCFDVRYVAVIAIRGIGNMVETSKMKVYTDLFSTKFRMFREYWQVWYCPAEFHVLATVWRKVLIQATELILDAFSTMDRWHVIDSNAWDGSWSLINSAKWDGCLILWSWKQLCQFWTLLAPELAGNAVWRALASCGHENTRVSWWLHEPEHIEPVQVWSS